MLPHSFMAGMSAVNVLPNRKNVQPTKVKNLSFSCDDFGKRGKKVISNNTKKII